jgi:hypothetical protein
MSRLIGWLGGLAVAAKVGADDSVLPGQDRGDAMPRRVCPRMTMKQQDGRTRAPMANAQIHVIYRDPLERKPRKHPRSLFAVEAEVTLTGL